MTAKFVLEIDGEKPLSHERIGQYLDQLEILLGVPLKRIEISQDTEAPRIIRLYGDEEALARRMK